MILTPKLNRRHFLAGATALALAPRDVYAQSSPRQGGTLRLLVTNEPTSLVPIQDTGSTNTHLSTKVTEGLYGYGLDFSLRPQLALSHVLSADGKELTFNLRPGVKWHDGQPFTAADVAFSLATLKEFHPRGRSTFANVEEFEVVDDHTITLRLSNPAPYLLNALAGQESPIIPKHLYEGTDLPTNPHNRQPVGTGPFKFGEWSAASHIILERNPEYWDGGKPYLDRIIVRFIPDVAGRAIALETNEVDIGIAGPVAYSDVARLRANPALAITTEGYRYSPVIAGFDFNLENQYFSNLLVRKAVAHAIDKDVILQTAFNGLGNIATGPIHSSQVKFYNPNVPRYAFDVAKANALLDEAALPRNEAGTRFAVTLDPMPASGDFHRLVSEYARQALAEIGIDVTLRSQDLPGYTKQVYTDRAFDFIHNSATTSPDPTLGVQRFFWSKNIQNGVPFTNATYYSNARVDELLEAAQIEIDEDKRAEEFKEFQQIVVTELPTLHTVERELFTVASLKVKDHSITADGLFSNLAETYLEE